MTFVTQVQSGDGEGREPNLREQKNTQKQENFSFFSDKKRQNFSKASQQKLSIPTPQRRNGTNNSPFGTGRLSETQKQQQVVSITYEEIGLFPRSFNRVFDRFFKQLFFDVENFVIQEYRFYRYLFLTTVKCLFILIFVPLSVNFLAKNYFIRPITEYFWNTQNHEIFLNSYQQKKAFSEFKNFEEKIYFESFLFSDPSNSFHSKNEFYFENPKKDSSEEVSTSISLSPSASIRLLPHLDEVICLHPSIPPSLHPSATRRSGEAEKWRSGEVEKRSSGLDKVLALDYVDAFDDVDAEKADAEKADSDGEAKMAFQMEKEENLSFSRSSTRSISLPLKSERDASNFQNSLQKRLQTKIVEFAKHYNEESIEAVTNFFADILSFATLWFLLVRLEIQINITKSFLLEVFFGLDDSKKSLLILFITDLLVGYHSPNIWELFFQTLFDHYGLPESQTTIFLLVATLPVLLDVLFKYLIFRHLNRASPATVATYHAMIE
jgi:hypothetical protein